jgi:hypothetical protein
MERRSFFLLLRRSFSADKESNAQGLHPAHPTGRSLTFESLSLQKTWARGGGRIYILPIVTLFPIETISRCCRSLFSNSTQISLSMDKTFSPQQTNQKKNHFFDEK